MTTLLDVLREADREKVAIGHFNVSDSVTLRAVAEAAREVNHSELRLPWRMESRMRSPAMGRSDAIQTFAGAIGGRESSDACAFGIVQSTFTRERGDALGQLGRVSGARKRK
jgi:hypothetical protein